MPHDARSYPYGTLLNRPRRPVTTENLAAGPRWMHNHAQPGISLQRDPPRYCGGKPSNAHQATLAPLDLRQVSQGIAQDGIRLWRHTWDTLGMLMPRLKIEHRSSAQRVITHTALGFGLSLMRRDIPSWSATRCCSQPLAPTVATLRNSTTLSCCISPARIRP